MVYGTDRTKKSQPLWSVKVSYDTSELIDRCKVGMNDNDSQALETNPAEILTNNYRYQGRIVSEKTTSPCGIAANVARCGCQSAGHYAHLRGAMTSSESEAQGF